MAGVVPGSGHSKRRLRATWDGNFTRGVYRAILEGLIARDGLLETGEVAAAVGRPYESVRTMLQRLAQRGFVAGTQRKPLGGRGGSLPKQWAVTSSGRRALHRADRGTDP